MVAGSLEETYRLQRIIDGLLLLSRADSRDVARVQVDLSAVAWNRWSSGRRSPRKPESGSAWMPFRRLMSRPCPGAAEQIIDNLIDNALAVAPPGSQITTGGVHRE